MKTPPTPLLAQQNNPRHLWHPFRRRQQNLESGPKSLHNSTDFELDTFRKRTHLSSTFRFRLHKPRGQSQQPNKSIRL